jgi:hypothetical protein
MLPQMLSVNTEDLPPAALFVASIMAIGQTSEHPHVAHASAN